jgi:antitoxin component YwqK of YwqJK toxin-antitoxin module
MKNINLLLALFLLGSMTLNAQRLNSEGLYVNEEGSLFSGTVSTVKNSIRSELEVKDGVLNGKADYYYASSGLIMEAGNYKKGLREGKWTRFFDNGNIFAVGLYKHGNKDGTWLVYDEFGNKRFEMNYDEGEKTGTWKNWDQHGVVMNTKSYSSRN